MSSEVNLKEAGKQKIEWARNRMPVLESISKRWSQEKPLAGVKVGACLHVTSKTANLLITLIDGGADVSLCGSNPLSTQDDVAKALNEVYGVPTYAKRGEDKESFYNRILTVLDMKPDITVDDGADLINTLHSERTELLKNVLGGTEETTTGVTRLKAMAKDNRLNYPVIAVNDAMTKHMFDNRYGTGQSTIDGLMRATNYLLAGAKFVVVGYGWCGRGVAKDAKGLGARVTVVEVDPVRALEASLDGFDVKSMDRAAAKADFIVTTTGNKNVVDKHHLEQIKDGCILSNAGHFNVEINIEALEEMSNGKQTVRKDVEEYQLNNGKKVYTIGEGRLVNLSAGEGHPADVMDMSFSNQALSVEYIAKGDHNLKNDVYSVPKHIDESIAKLKLEAMGMELERLTSEQVEYLNSWKIGT
ncbi:adenosylhomocysteinase [Natranaerobius trueperi]|uniref:adenosylhomocysteinase n=1 Tax=Natranaerobius trueperi TaxID=759412 RepID=UPI001F0B4FD6|nr:adenosylhomocysteinase [Natranaerobius trueperi]